MYDLLLVTSRSFTSPGILSKSRPGLAASMLKIFKHKPRRLYMAFYPRDNQKPDHTTHTALLLVPDPKSNTKSSFRYHISTLAGDNHWQYKRDELQPASEGLSFGRTPHLAALVFIDYVSSDEAEIRKIMASVPLKQCDVDWWCYHWVWDVLIRLEKAKIIRRLPEGGPEKIWQNGLQFCKQHGTSKDEIVPTCDVDGNRLLSEL